MNIELLHTVLQTTIAGAAAAATSDPWQAHFMGLDQDQRFVILIIAIGCGTGVIISLVGILAGLAGGVHRRKMEADMKRDMLDRGMTAEDITKVIEAAPPPEDAVGRWVNSWCKNGK